MCRLMLLTLVLLVSACSLRPGMEMKTENNLSKLEVPVMRNGRMVKEKPRIVPITADLIIERENSRLQAVNNLPPVDISKDVSATHPEIVKRLAETLRQQRAQGFSRD